ncbi:AAA family ATPase [Nocardia bovistercoris]|uniref:ATP-binding protein n=1 Tax=Nocardia bovistercoris TaxID=2785916 RepID=A0A931II61_9NOCA|nr:ATP-binding protein [Nocardia bovistercoris]MBH0780145.1 ATP-binding protein [Nocardia bovistercoris]
MAELLLSRRSIVLRSIVIHMAALMKPDRVFDRVREWEGLARFASSPSSDVRLGIVSGRRRQGKTFLLDALAEAVGGFFFTATDSTEAEALRGFGEAVASYAGGGRYAFRDWDEALERLFAVVGDGLVVIDEFPYLSKASPSLPSVLQRALDPRGSARKSGARILLCGSAMSVMGNLLSGNAPLRGRASMELIVRPLGYLDAARFWDIDDPRLAVLVHSIVGGTPAYRREFVAGDAPESLADFDSWVLRTVLDPQVPLFREARYLLAEETEIRDVALYHAVLGAIAGGHTTRGGIANAIGRSSTDIGHPLSVLDDAQLITREADPFNRGKSTYRIAEPLIVFYEAIMRREWTRLERGNTEAAWRNSQATFRSQVVGPHFEGICREWAMAVDAEVFGELPGQVAAATVNDPRDKKQIQVDVAVLAPEETGHPRRILSLGEVKWDRTMTLGHLERLERARELLSAKGYDTRNTVLSCYSGAGFDENLRAAGAAPGERAGETDAPMLVDLDAIYALE